ncbi:hypothetical protein HK105_202003 [Polyrhizophydium stewartii]|uniref:Uncharacterized protein n=1 Tax=Polyrhizophydium stewartii TaxID=2732419 RepID=A0ABR4NGF6_9FUNG|nr:hypothetical protein HK105_005682 [Polyrhizophydium stewartii]
MRQVEADIQAHMASIGKPVERVSLYDLEPLAAKDAQLRRHILRARELLVEYRVLHDPMLPRPRREIELETPAGRRVRMVGVSAPPHDLQRQVAAAKASGTFEPLKPAEPETPTLLGELKRLLKQALR